MTEASFAVLMLLVLGWAVESHLLARANITGALVFLVTGYLLGNPSWGPLAVDVEAPSVHLLAELTLALLLFSDASRVNVALLGAGLDRPTVLFVGWLGPRGLASVVFALLAIEELGESSMVGQAVAVVALTVLLSVVLHGVSAGPLGSRYVREEVQLNPDEVPRSRRAAHSTEPGAT